MTFSLQPYNILAGAIVSLVCAFLFGRYFVDNTHKFLQPARYFWLFLYIFILFWECLKANFDVAYRVLHPALPVKPGIVRVPLKVKSDIARAFLANSITLTPGTISVDIIGDFLYVHWIYVSTTDPDAYTHQISGRFEKYIEKIFE
jgi:multicomponent Na+:H+ antiporter subunit E